uniref:Uncharacterized protein n=1 Tax=Octopus bimaculoides TaxID=37653 RepID=A0A0L8IF14_OCTBM
MPKVCWTRADRANNNNRNNANNNRNISNYLRLRNASSSELMRVIHDGEHSRPKRQSSLGPKGQAVLAKMVEHSWPK